MLNEHYEGDGAVIYKHVCTFGCEGIVSKRTVPPSLLGNGRPWSKPGTRGAQTLDGKHSVRTALRS